MKSEKRKGIAGELADFKKNDSAQHNDREFGHVLNHTTIVGRATGSLDVPRVETHGRASLRVEQPTIRWNNPQHGGTTNNTVEQPNNPITKPPLTNDNK